jgi:large subunit ribosomal protein L22
MNTATAQLNNYRQSPRKVRLMADLIRGKNVEMAKAALAFAPKRASEPFLTLLNSAVANAKNLDLNIETLVVSGVSVNAGQVLKRSMPVSRGRAHPIKKRTSKISITLSEKNK